MTDSPRTRPPWAIMAHGGAGAIAREDLTPAQDAAYRTAMAAATEAGATVLKLGGRALDAVEVGVRRLEDDPLFNAGRGSAFTAEGVVQLDAAIMDGETLRAGSVAGVSRARHPIAAARAVMERSPYVFLVGQGADAFAADQGLEQVDASYFYTERRWRSLEKALRAGGLPLPDRPPGAWADAAPLLTHEEGKFGTVGVVARDQYGRLAAGTSTGGTMAKRWGRVGDTPIIGAGTYANPACAVSATGAGEYFIRLTVAREICALVEHRGMSLQSAADVVVQERLVALGGDGGVIAVSSDGGMASSFNTSGMYRAWAADGLATTAQIYKDEPASTGSLG